MRFIERHVPLQRAAEIIFELIPEDVLEKHKETFTREKFFLAYSQGFFAYTRFIVESDLKRMILFLLSEWRKTDESGTGGLFGASVFVGVKLTKSIYSRIKKLTWFEEVFNVRDSKKIEEQRCIFLSEQIEKELVENKDFVIVFLSIDNHNRAWRVVNSSNSIKSSCHNRIHNRLVEDTTFHVIDNFFRRTESHKYYESLPQEEIVPIDKFCSSGENKALSISLASIIARGRYLKNFYKLMQELGIELSDKENHNLPVTKIEPLLKQLESQGKSREYVFNTFCKQDIVQKYQFLNPN